jgi:hypothetical protein
MAVTTTETARVVISDALRKLNVVAYDESMDADQASNGARALNRMLKSWQNRGLNLWGVTAMSVAATTAASYTLTLRPLEILNIRYKNGTNELPMWQMTREEYDDLPNKSSTGTPTTFYFNRQRETATITVWPVLAVTGTATFEISYQREFEDVDLDTAPDVPGEYWEAMVYGLAARLADDYSVDGRTVTARAEEELRLALAFDREGSLYFHGDR